MGAISVVSMAFVIEYLISAIVEKDANSFYKAVIIIFFYIIIDSVMDYAVEKVNDTLDNHLMHDIREDLTNKIYSETIYEYEKKGGAFYLSKFSNELNTLDDEYIKPLMSIYNDILVFIIAVILSIKIEPIFTVIMVGLCILPLIFPHFTSKKLQKYNEQAVLAREKYFKYLEEMIRNIPVIKIYNASGNINKNIKLNNSLLTKGILKQKLANKKTSATSYGIQMTLNMATWIIGGYLVVSKKIGLPEFFALRQLVNYISFPMQGLSANYVDIISSIKVKDKVLDFINDGTSKKKKEIKEFESLRLKNATLTLNHTKILNNINLNINKGEKFLIVGESGSGKSSLIKILLGIFPISNGTLIINDEEKFEDKYNLLNMIGYVQQNSSIFSGTIKDNVTLFSDKFTEDEIKAALMSAGLSEFTDKLNLHINNEDSRLSGGQERRIELARVFLYDKEIIVLDEPTTGLDKQNSLFIEEEIKKMKDKTILYISHHYNPSFVDYFDYKVEVSNGSITIDKV